ncbi:MAG TPA: ArsB/NhaD family transporter [Ktedonobacterales bacterium]
MLGLLALIGVARLVVAAVILLVTLALVVARPRGLDVAWFAGGGALLSLALGLLSVAALGAVVADTWDAAATLIALFALSESLDANGFFTWAALWLARVAGGSGARLYGLALALTAVTTALVANDGAVLMLTPIFARLLTAIYPERRLRLPILFAVGFLADAMSALFVPSNLTNIILADATGLSFARAAAWMALPMLAAFAVAGVAFGLRFRRALVKPYDVSTLDAPASAVRDWTLFRVSWVALGALVVGYIIGGELRLPVSLIAGTIALVLLALTQARGVRSASESLRQAPWSVLVYAIGMFVVMTAAFDAHALDDLTGPLIRLASAPRGGAAPLAAGALLGLLAAVVNNLPAALIGVLALGGAGHAHRITIYAIMLGVDIGPKLTPFGSLATLLWLGILERNGVHISWGRFLRENWWVTLLALAAALGALYLVGLALGRS